MKEQESKNNTPGNVTAENIEIKSATPTGKVKMVYSGIIRFIPKNRVNEFEKKGYVKM